MKDQCVVVHRDPDILGGTPVFVGTRVPVKALLDYLAGGHTLDDFLDDFPTVSRVQASCWWAPMWILLDECVPRKLRGELPGHDIKTVAEMGWAGTKNGVLLR